MDKPKFEIGDYCRVLVDRPCGAPLSRGDAVVVMGSSQVYFTVRKDCEDADRCGWWVKPAQIELISAPAPAADPALNYLKRKLSDPEMTRNDGYLRALSDMLAEVYGLAAVTETVFKEAF